MLKNRYVQGILLLIAVFILYNWFFNDKKELKERAYEIEAGSRHALLKLPSGESFVLNVKDTTFSIKHPNMQIRTDSLSAQLVSNVSTYTTRPSQITIESPKGGEYCVTLYDGTTVWLNADSRLSFPECFSTHQREVYAVGEVYFNVARDMDRPFIVHFNDNKIEVLGTEFNVRCYDDDAYNGILTVVEGSVKLNANQQEVILTPSQQAIIKKNSARIDVTMVNPNVFAAWKEGKFVYNNSSLEAIMNDLSRWYQVKVSYQEKDLRDIKFSMFTNRYNSIESMLEILEATDMIHYDIHNNNVTIKTFQNSP